MRRHLIASAPLLLLLLALAAPLAAQAAPPPTPAAAPAPAGTICIAPFEAEEGLGGPLMSTTPSPAKGSLFELRIGGELRAKVAEGETARISGLSTTGITQIGVRLDGGPFETLTLDLSAAPDQRICLWLRPGYWHWIDSGWSESLGCRCTAEWPAELARDPA
jgi:hypothetical protein